jgi:multiple sugar transport system substrate-binding protein
MRRVRWLCLVLAALLLGAAGCGGGSSSSSNTSVKPGSVDKTPVTITLWHPWTGDEKKLFEQALDGFKTQYPWITLKLVGFPDSDVFDQQVIKAVKGGNAPDAVLSFGPDYVGQYCSSGLWQDLKPHMDADGIKIEDFAPAAISYTNFDDKQCALPSLTDAYGLYYNTDMFAKAGITDPPKTLDELAEDAKKLTVKNSDGTLKVVGFVPLQNWEQLGISDIARAYGGEMLDDSGQPVVSSDPAWPKAFEWQKSLIDFYGYENITKFFAANTDSEFSASNAFETGKVAMMWDGEWRTAFIAREHPELKYATAPFPVGEDNTDNYGSARVGGTIVGIPDGSPNPDAAWLVVKYLSTDTGYLTFMANKVRNVPTTNEAATSPDFQNDDNFQTFIDVWNNPASKFFPPLTAAGGGYFTPLEQFTDKWQAGQVSDLQGGLDDVNNQMAQQLSQGQVP